MTHEYKYINRPVPLQHQPLTEMQRKGILALESGDYNQGKPGILRDDEGGFCCLGVFDEACNLGEFDYDTLRSTYDTMGLRNPSGTSKAQEEAWYCEYAHEIPGLSVLNDGLGTAEQNIGFAHPECKRRHSFARIAAQLRNYPEQYFVEER